MKGLWLCNAKHQISFEKRIFFVGSNIINKEGLCVGDICCFIRTWTGNVSRSRSTKSLFLLLCDCAHRFHWSPSRSSVRVFRNIDNRNLHCRYTWATRLIFIKCCRHFTSLFKHFINCIEIIWFWMIKSEWKSIDEW